ncbi:MAG: ECF transporter S component [Clostridiales bacterium]|nr:ECF transporter S component [Clostridiales bacterium]
MKLTSVRKLVMTALFIALGLVLPSFFHMFGTGAAFLPMHIPVLLCGFLCGPLYGLACGMILPLVSSVLTGMPVLFPTGTAMVFELGTYGLMTGLLYKKLACVKGGVYISLVAAMLLGRAVSGIANSIFMGMAGKAYGMTAFLTGAFVTALPGILIQLVLIPPMVLLLRKVLNLNTK